MSDWEGEQVAVRPMLRNHTPHVIVITSPNGEVITTLAPSGAAPRLQLDVRPDVQLDGIPVVTTTTGVITGLPDPQPGVHLIVSQVIAAAARDAGRTVEDLLVPHGQVRNDKGQPIGCTALARVVQETPAMTQLYGRLMAAHLNG